MSSWTLFTWEDDVGVKSKVLLFSLLVLDMCVSYSFPGAKSQIEDGGFLFVLAGAQ